MMLLDGSEGGQMNTATNMKIVGEGVKGAKVMVLVDVSGEFDWFITVSCGKFKKISLSTKA